MDDVYFRHVRRDIERLLPPSARRIFMSAPGPVQLLRGSGHDIPAAPSSRWKAIAPSEMNWHATSMKR